MKTTINIKDEVLAQLMEMTQAKTKTEAVNRALEDYVRLKSKDLLLSLPGKITLDENYRQLRDRDRHGA